MIKLINATIKALVQMSSSSLLKGNPDRFIKIYIIFFNLNTSAIMYRSLKMLLMQVT